MNEIYTPGHVANHVLDRAFAERHPVTQMKLQKLVYIGYGWTLALLDQKLFDEPIYAWKHGPVIKSLYDEFKHYGATPIDQYSMNFDLDSSEIHFPRIPDSDQDVDRVLNMVWGVYKNFKAVTLRNKTHEQGSPWCATYRPDRRNLAISDELIKSHFKSKITEYLENARQAA